MFVPLIIRAYGKWCLSKPVKNHQTNIEKTASCKLTCIFLSLPSSYSFAIVGINITDLAYSLLVSGALKTHLYNVAPEMPSLLHFQQTFCEFNWSGYICKLFSIFLQNQILIRITPIFCFPYTVPYILQILSCFGSPLIFTIKIRTGVKAGKILTYHILTLKLCLLTYESWKAEVD